MADDEVARRERAARLRKQIADLTSPPAGASGESPGDRAKQKPGESDAEYVQRRMRDLEREPPRGSD